jgi:signal-transduction protein with cAMP-binding, CBS, and nucleotidyltransferase domain
MDSSKKVKDFMVSKVQMVEESSKILEVTKMMAKYNIGAVVVMSAIKDAVGIFTERDLMRRVVAQELDVNSPIKEVMTPDFQCVQMEDSLHELPQIMLNGNFRHLPVVEGRKVVGIISIRDVMRIILQS